MATTVEVSTWAELVSAMTYPNLQNDVIVKLIADIDMNDTNPQGVSQYFDYQNWSQHTLVVDGGYTDDITGEQKRHVIKNLRTPTNSTGSIFNFFNGSQYIYDFVRYIQFKNLDFQNIILSSGAFIFLNTNLRTVYWLFDNCRFCGQRSDQYWLNPEDLSKFNITINRCYFDLPWNGQGKTNLAYTSLIPKNDSSASNAVATYCRFKETYGNWEYSTVTNLYRYDSPAFFSFSYFKVSGCRIEGEMTLPRGEYIDARDYTHYGMYAKLLGKPTANSYTPSAQNVFDVKLTLGTDNYQSGDTVNVSGWSGVVKKDAVRYDGETAFNDYIYVQGNGDYGGAIAPLFATPEQMKDASWLYSNGFTDIIVPAT